MLIVEALQLEIANEKFEFSMQVIDQFIIRQSYLHKIVELIADCRD